MPESTLTEEAKTRLRRIEGQVRGIQAMLDDLDGDGLECRARELLERGMSQSAAARTLGISRRRLAGVLRGRPAAAACEPCDGLLTQILAVRAAVEQVGLMIMELHLQRCVLEGIPVDEARLNALRDSLKLWSRLNARSR
jgi:DNA-binding FrmR family transcriptional regulator